MFLKKMIILGFKSFADKTEIHFQDGVTALLGPNGCGKSNVVDAIKWVLGEQSTRNMRAESMVDVIFNGTEQRKALNVAEVTLVIANETSHLDLDMPEIEVKRRLFRSGESEYYINNASVRLKELRELFLDTGVGKSAYSIMEQGKIDQILSHKPEDRRYIFEEAAGITRFKIRGAEAERKLKKTEENMAQVDNILHEVKRNHDSLKKQSQKTLEYRKRKEKIFQLEVQLRRLTLENLIAKEKRHSEKQEKQRAKLKKETTAISSLTSHLKEKHHEVDHMEQQRIENQKRLYGLDIEEENKVNLLQQTQERRQEQERERDKQNQREQQQREGIAALDKQKEERQKEVQALDDRMTEIDGTLFSLEKTIKQSEDSVEKLQQKIQNGEEEARRAEEQREKLQEELRVLTEHIVNELDSGLGKTGFSLAKKNQLMEKIKEELDLLAIQMKGKADQLKDQGVNQLDKSKNRQDFLDGLSQGLQDWIGGMDHIHENLQGLDNIFPAFLEDFLSPQGIIVQRRKNEEAMEQLHNKMKQVKEEKEEMLKQIEKLQNNIEETRKLLEDYRVNRVRLSTQKAAVEDAIQAILKEREREDHALQEILEQTAELQKKIQQIVDQQTQLEKEKKNIQEEKEKLRKELSKLELGINQSSADLQGQEKELKDRKAVIQDLTISCEKEEMALQHIKEEIEQLYGDFRDRYSRELKEFLEEKLPENLSAQDLRSKVSQEKQLLRSLGQVNLMAPEEYGEVKERYDFLLGQMEDLRKAREDLSEVTQEIRKESEQRFVETFKQVEENFHQMFRRLFGGGRGEFKLSDPDNILESGIEIYAQPPGKKLENISLLSGGERSLTGVGLLFATYLVKPSPFCILDEMDAALDDANIQRFVHVLMDFAKTSQFVVITHNKKTVTGARTLLGVTMQESGVSKLVSMRMEESD